MKKLLVILLLFFPVHGVLGANKLHLSCSVKMFRDPPTVILPVIDLKKNIVTNPHGLFMGNALITDTAIVWKDDRKVMERRYGKNDTIFSYQINRINGQYTVFVEELDLSFYGDCKKISGKKKF